GLRPELLDDTGGLVAREVRNRDERVPAVEGMGVGPAYSDVRAADQDFPGRGGGDGLVDQLHGFDCADDDAAVGGHDVDLSVRPMGSRSTVTPSEASGESGSGGATVVAARQAARLQRIARAIRSVGAPACASQPDRSASPAPAVFTGVRAGPWPRTATPPSVNT